jgi:hypothetical protein
MTSDLLRGGDFVGFPELLDTGDHEITLLFFVMILCEHQQGIFGKNRLRTKFAGYRAL